MTRNFKALGLAVLAVMAVGAFSAASASATPAQFHSHATHTILKAEQHAAEDEFTVNAGTVKCSHATYEGTQNSATTSSVTVTPVYTGCKAFGFVNATIDVNGCGYNFTANSTTGAHPTGLVDIECPAGSSITVTAFNCWVTVGSQNALSSVTFTNNHSGSTSETDVTVDVAITGITYTQHSKTFPGCSSGTFNNGVYNGAATVRGFDTEGKQVGVWYH